MININEYQAIHENKSHFDYNIPYNTYPCTIPLDFDSVPLHWHEDAEFIYIKKGAGIIVIDGREHQVSAGDIAFILPSTVHGIYQYENESMEYEDIIFDLAGRQYALTKIKNVQLVMKDTDGKEKLFELGVNEITKRWEMNGTSYANLKELYYDIHL